MKHITNEVRRRVNDRAVQCDDDEKQEAPCRPRELKLTFFSFPRRTISVAVDSYDPSST